MWTPPPPNSTRLLSTAKWCLFPDCYFTPPPSRPPPPGRPHRRFCLNVQMGGFFFFFPRMLEASHFFVPPQKKKKGRLLGRKATGGPSYEGPFFLFYFWPWKGERL